ncbi:MAG: tetratricopeptide repeat protein [Acidobacteriota bacterium]
MTPWLVLVAAGWGCGAGADRIGDAEGTPEPTPKVYAMPAMPDLETLDAPSAAQLSERLERVRRLKGNPRADAEGRGWAWGELGMVLHAYTEFEPAATCYRYAAELDPSDPRWTYYLAHIHRADGRFPESTAGFSRVLELSPDSAPSLFWRARNSTDTAEWSAAKMDFEAILERQPDHVGATLGLAQVALAAGDAAAALDLLDALEGPGGLADARGTPPTALVEIRLAAHRQLGNLDEAKALAALLPEQKLGRVEFALSDPWMEAVAALRVSAQTAARRGMRFILQGRYDEAQPWLEEALELDPERADVRHNLAAVLVRRGKGDEALEVLEEAVARTDHGPSRLLLARLYLARGRDDDAERLLRTALVDDPASAAAHAALGELHRYRGAWPLALESFRRARAEAEQHELAHVGESMTLFAQGEVDASLETLRRSLEILPESRLLRHLRWRVAGIRSPAEASSALVELEASGPLTSASQAETRAWLLAAAGRFEEAVEIQTSVLAALENLPPEDVARRIAGERLARYRSSAKGQAPWPPGERFLELPLSPRAPADAGESAAAARP